MTLKERIAPCPAARIFPEMREGERIAALMHYLRQQTRSSKNLIGDDQLIPAPGEHSVWEFARARNRSFWNVSWMRRQYHFAE